MDWLAEHLRFTVFTTEPATAPLPVDWWLRTVEQEPENSAVQQSGALRHEEGPLDSGTLQLERTPGRIEWRLVPRLTDSDEPSDDDLLNVGTWDEVRKRFMDDVVLKWLSLDDVPPIGRLAFGCVLQAPVETKEDGYSRLDVLLPAVQVDPDTSDFQYQVNRRRSSVVEADLEVNRLSRWSVGAAAHLTIAFGVESRATQRTAGHHVRLQLDVNTVPTPSLIAGGLPAASLSSVAGELAQLAVEIAENGDVP